MISKIGVIVQDSHSLGLLEGMKRRFGCDAELVQPVGPVGKSTYLNRGQAKSACAQFKHKGVDIILRFTDADNDRWQDVRKKELRILEKYACGTPVVCGVAVRNTEHWLVRMGVAAMLQVNLNSSDDPTGDVKGAIGRRKPSGEGKPDYVARLVSDQADDTFKQAFDCNAFDAFYSDCRAIAKRFDCDVSNER